MDTNEPHEPPKRTYENALNTPAGLEVSPEGQDGKEVVGSENEKEVVHSETPQRDVKAPLMQPDQEYLPQQSGDQPRQRRICGLRLKVFWVLLVVCIVLVVGLGIGLGVGLSSGNSSSDSSPTASPTSSGTPAESQPMIGGALDASYFSDRGAWNGSGLANSWQTLGEEYPNRLGNLSNLVIYYQHHSGEIRWQRRSSTGAWLRGPEDLEVIATDAKNSTAISGINYNEGDANVWQVFYIDHNYKVKQRSSSDKATGWTDGTINSLNLESHHGDLIGLRACWAGKNTSSPMSLWYASDDTTFQEYLYEEGQWKWQKEWEPYNGAAGVGCFSWGQGPYRYVGFVTLDDQLEIWWQNSTSTDGPAAWEKTGVVIDGLHPASSLAFFVAGLVVQKAEQNRLWLYKMRWNGRNTRLDDEGTFLENEMLGGAHIAALPTSDTFLIYSQSSGNDITEASRAKDKVGTPWDYENIAI